MYVELLSVETMHTACFSAADEPLFVIVRFEDVLSLSGERRLTDTCTTGCLSATDEPLFVFARVEDVVSLRGDGCLTDTCTVSGVLSTSLPSAATHFTIAQHTFVMKHQAPKQPYRSSSACATEAGRFMPAAREAWR